MPDVGRFFNVDPLAEKYSYQSPYNFSENRVIDGRELEGLEWVSTKIYDLQGNITFYQDVAYKTKNSSSNLSNSDVNIRADGIAKNTENVYSGRDASGNYVATTANIESGTATQGADFYLDFVDKVQGVSNPNVVGLVDDIRNTQVNRVQVLSKLNNSNNDETGSHELGHTAGLRHEVDTLNPKVVLSSMGSNNIMNASNFGNTQSTPEQRTEMQNSIPTTVKMEISKNVYVKPFFNPE